MKNGKYIIVTAVIFVIIAIVFFNFLGPSKDVLVPIPAAAWVATAQQRATVVEQPSFTPSKDATTTPSAIEIPFLGRVPVKQAKQTVKYGSERAEQEWVFSWSEEGAFVQADYQRNGFQTQPRNYTSEDVHSSSGEKILSIVKEAPNFEFERIIKLIDEYCDENVVDKVRVRRVVISSPIYGEVGRPLYLVKIWSDDVYPVKTPGLSNEVAPVLRPELMEIKLWRRDVRE